MQESQLDLLQSAGRVRTPEQALAFWAQYEHQLEKAALILSTPGQLHPRAPLRGTFGRSARLVSLFADDGVFVLDRQIYHDMRRGIPVQIPIEYMISFDTSTASHFRTFFTGPHGSAQEDILCLLRQFHGRLNFSPFPYLCENAHAFESGCPSVIFETILGTHRLADLDAEAFTTSDQLIQQSPMDALRAATEKEVEGFMVLLRKGWGMELERRRRPMYAIILKMAVLQMQWPGRDNAIRKLRALIEFMDTHLHTMYLLLAMSAWEWFMDSDRATIFRRLQRHAPNLIKEAQSITWDFYHMLQFREQAVIPTRRPTYVIPHFLTFDQGLADLIELCALRSCFIEEAKQFPVSFPKQDHEDWLEAALGDDPKFIEDHFNAEASARRNAARQSDNRDGLVGLIDQLQAQLLEYQRAD